MSSVNENGSDSPRNRPLTSFQPASSLPRDPNSRTASNLSAAASVVQPRPRPLIRGAQGGTNTILVNSCQRGNPLLQHIRSIGWEYADVVPDYVVGVSSCILFLSIRYHRLHPEYIHTRIQKLSTMFTLRILLLLCDVNDHSVAIKELTKTALINNLTLIVAWTPEEAGKYVETYKSFEHKSPDPIKERVGEDYLSQVTNVLTQVRGVNKTDVVTLLTRYGGLKEVIKAARDGGGGEGGLEMCPGFGEVKAKRLRDVFSQPFRVGESRTYKQRKMGSGIGSTSDARGGNGGRVVGLGEDDFLLSTSDTTTTTPSPAAAVAATDPSVAKAAGTSNKRALDTLQENLDDLTEEEQLRLAMQLSMPSPPSPSLTLH